MTHRKHGSRSATHRVKEARRQEPTAKIPRYVPQSAAEDAAVLQLASTHDAILGKNERTLEDLLALQAALAEFDLKVSRSNRAALQVLLSLIGTLMSKLCNGNHPGHRVIMFTMRQITVERRT